MPLVEQPGRTDVVLDGHKIPFLDGSFPAWEVREADHRIRNNLQLVASLLISRAGSMDAPIARDALRIAATQVTAIAELHSFLHSGATDVALQDGKIELAGYLEGLIYNLARAMDFKSDHRSMQVEARVGLVAADTARSVGLIVTELATNAIRHAFAPAAPGKVVIRSAPAPGSDGGWRIEVEDNGQGLPLDFDMRLRPSGFGLRFVNLLVDQLQARLTIERRKGACLRLSLP